MLDFSVLSRCRFHHHIPLNLQITVPAVTVSTQTSSTSNTTPTPTKTEEKPVTAEKPQTQEQKKEDKPPLTDIKKETPTTGTKAKTPVPDDDSDEIDKEIEENQDRYSRRILIFFGGFVIFMLSLFVLIKYCRRSGSDDEVRPKSSIQMTRAGVIPQIDEEEESDDELRS
eukprot:TRINITY_DN2516_c0_g1_i1.p1 TRINITY_DN2516_c0_g1~~TRINITY_DN2516_c0_g1_i1.p1  ORF type:complete len:170 (-),score=40.15 TRINITY_DN2516_c0_g1_i1:86-595(-)